MTETQRRHVVRSERGYWAFVPPALPPDLTFDLAFIERLSDADRSLGLLAGVARTLPNPHLLSRALVRREAVLSSRIEGTQASLSELVLFEVEPPAKPTGGDVQEVFNYVAALDQVLSPDRRLPLSLPLLLEAHRTLLTGVRGGYATPGEFRRPQNWIGPPGCMLDDATYTPPPPEQLWECLDPFEKYLHADRALPALVNIACAHYQFEAIHPFIDGNGRVGRLLITLLLAEWGLLADPLLDFSAYVEPRRDEYYARLLAVSTHGDWVGWIRFFLEAVDRQAQDAVLRAQRLQSLQDHWRSRVTTARSTGLLILLVDALFETPAISINRAASVLGVTHRAARLNVEKLVDAGILREVTGRTRTRLFIAEDILRAVEGLPLPTMNATTDQIGES